MNIFYQITLYILAVSVIVGCSATDDIESAFNDEEVNYEVSYIKATSSDSISTDFADADEMMSGMSLTKADGSSITKSKVDDSTLEYSDESEVVIRAELGANQIVQFSSTIGTLYISEVSSGEEEEDSDEAYYFYLELNAKIYEILVYGDTSDSSNSEESSLYTCKLGKGGNCLACLDSGRAWNMAVDTVDTSGTYTDYVRVYSMLESPEDSNDSLTQVTLWWTSTYGEELSTTKAFPDMFLQNNSGQENAYVSYSTSLFGREFYYQYYDMETGDVYCENGTFRDTSASFIPTE